MKGSGRLITGSLRASARVFGHPRAFGWAIHSGVTSSANTTDESGANRFLHVAPSEPQQLVWLVPQYGVDYTVTTSTGLNWQIK